MCLRALQDKVILYCTIFISSLSCSLENSCSIVFFLHLSLLQGRLSSPSTRHFPQNPVDIMRRDGSKLLDCVSLALRVGHMVPRVIRNDLLHSPLPLLPLAVDLLCVLLHHLLKVCEGFESFPPLQNTIVPHHDVPGDVFPPHLFVHLFTGILPLFFGFTRSWSGMCFSSHSCSNKSTSSCP